MDDDLEAGFYVSFGAAGVAGGAAGGVAIYGVPSAAMLAGVGTAVGREILDEAIDQGVSYVTDGKVDGLPMSAADIAEGLAKRAIRNGIKNACEAGANDAFHLGLKAKRADVALNNVPTGQIHHPISTKIGRELGNHPTLSGQYMPGRKSPSLLPAP
jgi:hypothetical protein